MKMDSKGSATIEIAIVLIIILIILGVILTSFENSTDKVINLQEKEYLKDTTTEIADNLINNAGIPDNWCELSKGTPGLSIVNEGGEIIPNSISYQKFIALGSDYKKLVYENMFNSKIESSMELIPFERSISSVKIGSNEVSNEIFSVTRLVICDFYKKYVIKDFQNEGKCNHNHDQSSHSCNYFKIFKGNLKNSDYYLLLDDGEKYDLKYIVDTTRVVKGKYWQQTTSDEIYLNNEINFYDDTSAIVFIHFDKPKAKALLVSVPKDFDKNKLKYDYFRTNECKFIMKAWY